MQSKVSCEGKNHGYFKISLKLINLQNDRELDALNTNLTRAHFHVDQSQGKKAGHSSLNDN